MYHQSKPYLTKSHDLGALATHLIRYTSHQNSQKGFIYLSIVAGRNYRLGDEEDQPDQKPDRDKDKPARRPHVPPIAPDRDPLIPTEPWERPPPGPDPRRLPHIVPSQ